MKNYAFIEREGTVWVHHEDFITFLYPATDSRAHRDAQRYHENAVRLMATCERAKVQMLVLDVEDGRERLISTIDNPGFDVFAQDWAMVLYDASIRHAPLWRFTDVVLWWAARNPNERAALMAAWQLGGPSACGAMLALHAAEIRRLTPFARKPPRPARRATERTRT